MVRSDEQDASNVPPRGPPKSQSRMAFVWPFTVRSSSPSSQSQILRVVSSEPEAREENIGWKATHVTGDRWDWRVWRAGDRGSQVVGSWLRRERDVGVALSNSDWRFELRASRSIIWGHPRSASCLYTNVTMIATFFCKRTTLVHFFSRSPSYFLLVASSKASPIPSSCRRAAALFGSLTELR